MDTNRFRRILNTNPFTAKERTQAERALSDMVSDIKEDIDVLESCATDLIEAAWELGMDQGKKEAEAGK